MAVAIGKKDIRVFGTKNHAVNALLFDDLGLTLRKVCRKTLVKTFLLKG